MPCLDSIAPRLGRGVVTVVPVTSNTGRVHPFQVLLRSSETGLTIDSKAQAEQIRPLRSNESAFVLASCRRGSSAHSTRRYDSTWRSSARQWCVTQNSCPRRRPGTKADESRGLGGSNRLTLPSAIRPRPTVHRDGTESVYP